MNHCDSNVPSASESWQLGHFEKYGANISRFGLKNSFIKKYCKQLAVAKNAAINDNLTINLFLLFDTNFS